MTVAVAHRGDSSVLRENTVAAVASAVAKGAAAVEIDIRLTRDGEVVLLHDPTPQRLWGDPRPVADLTWAQVQRLGGDEWRIPALAEVLDLVAGTGTTLVVDTDSADPVAAAVALTRGRPGIAWCGDGRAMAAVRALDDDARIWAPWAAATPPTRTDLAALRPCTVNLPHLLVGPALVDAVHALGATVACWTVDDPDQMRRLAAIGVDSITTNRLDLLTAVLADPGPPDEMRRAQYVARELAAWAVDTVRAQRPRSVRTKAHPADHVTEIDTAIEHGVRAVIGAQFPGHRVVGEELGGESEPGVPCWYLDPVDGTANLANGVPWTSFSLACAVDRQPLVGVVADPWLGHVLEARAGHGARLDGAPLVVEPAGSPDDPLRGGVVGTELAGHLPWPGMLGLLGALGERWCTTRIMGSGTLAVAGVALGRGCGTVIGSFSPIDHLAATLVVREAGGVVLDTTGTPCLFPATGGVLAARDERTARELHALWQAAVTTASSAP